MGTKSQVRDAFYLKPEGSGPRRLGRTRLQPGLWGTEEEICAGVKHSPTPSAPLQLSPGEWFEPWVQLPRRGGSRAQLRPSAGRGRERAVTRKTSRRVGSGWTSWGILAGRGDSGAAGGEMLGPTVLGAVVAALVASMLLLQSGDEGSGAAPR